MIGDGLEEVCENGRNYEAYMLTLMVEEEKGLIHSINIQSTRSTN